jgi:signal transduction histidine kinase
LIPALARDKERGMVANPNDPDHETLLREVLGIVGHDLRNPLAAMRMTAQMLARTDPVPDERRVTLAKRILTSSTRMDGMVKALLDYAKNREATLIKLQREPMDLGELARRIAEEHEAAFPGRALQFEATGDLTGSWDMLRLEQVLASVINNAFRHGDESAPVLVRLDGGASDQVTLTVANGGPAIPPELLPDALFEPFKIGPRTPGTPRRSVGLGLFVTKQLVQAHGGSVSATSTSAQTTFTIQLPRQ